MVVSRPSVLTKSHKSFALMTPVFLRSKSAPDLRPSCDINAVRCSRQVREDEGSLTPEVPVFFLPFHFFFNESSSFFNFPFRSATAVRGAASGLTIGVGLPLGVWILSSEDCALAQRVGGKPRGEQGIDGGGVEGSMNAPRSRAASPPSDELLEDDCCSSGMRSPRRLRRYPLGGEVRAVNLLGLAVVCDAAMETTSRMMKHKESFIAGSLRPA
ncbi:hypothetical protein BCV69DRAFT_69981 [Microstroma glucosiphilum]|uniref:Uncharacterized protein n=1 Tax=Pseudomicrostroma glucosiphilum TaxID=1684307 RepID=A0A316U003_9BASI|nr:hypothetical protein BCV69DRAFT_69981 [Pseudomicrostroma glucosiphilum]PWN18677.1 hypothetical protein BCV69DRAFT_69981 [Pseudomicrostroma glucosiphilum]